MSYSRSPRALRSTTIGTRGMVRNLAVDRAHHRFGVPRARGLRQRVGDRAPLVTGQLHVGRRHVLLEVGAALRAGDGDDVLALVQHPGERELARGHALVGGELLEPADEVEVLLEVLALEARREATVVVLGEIVGGLDRAREEAAAERGVGDEAD